MAICPVCKTQGELCEECPNCHRHYIEEADLQKHPNDELLGTLISGQYVPLALIGEGGMGRIYKARAKYTGKIVALKILKSEYMEDETLKERFFREAEVVSALDHPNIVKLYGCAPVPEHNTIFMAMEMLVGRTLFDVLRRDVPPLLQMMKWYTEIADALGEAHKHGIFHRDLKPENIFIVKDENGEEHVRVLDFGFARLQGATKKLTMAGVAFGTPHYMSPEQALGSTEITGAVDVYALGVMLFQMVSGHVPFDSPNGKPMEIMQAQVYTNTPKCIPRKEYTYVPSSLIKCINKCMKKDPKDRYPDGTALCEVLTQITAEIEETVSMAKKPTIISDAVPARLSSLKLKLNQTTILIIVLVVLLIAIIIIAISLLS